MNVAEGALKLGAAMASKGQSPPNFICVEAGILRALGFSAYPVRLARLSAHDRESCVRIQSARHASPHLK